MRPKNKNTPEQLNPTDRLVAELSQLADRAMAIEAGADHQGRELNDEERAEIERIRVQFNEVQRQLNARDAIGEMNAALAQPMPRITAGAPLPPGPNARRPQSPGPWATPREFMLDVFNAARGTPSHRLMAAATSFGAEGVGPDGGFAVPPDFRAQIAELVFGDASLLQLCNVVPTSSSGLSMPVDSMAPHDESSGGLIAEWLGEGQTMTQRKPSLGKIEVKLHKLGVLVPLTDELLEDGPAVSAWLPAAVARRITAKLNEAILNGTGTGQLLGVLNSGALVTVAKETSQAADTVVAANVAKMWARLPPASKANAVWVINPDVEPQLQVMTLGQQPVYLPGGSMVNAGAARLFGRPVIPCEACEELGEVGDVVLFDPTQYLVGVKAGGLRTDFNLFAYFDQGISAFRFTMRLGGQPTWSAPYTRAKSANTASPFVTLAQRT